MDFFQTMIEQINTIITDSILIGVTNCILVALGFYFIIRVFIRWIRGDKGETNTIFGGVPGLKQIIITKVGFDKSKDYLRLEGVPLDYNPSKADDKVDWDMIFRKRTKCEAKTEKNSEDNDEIIAKIQTYGWTVHKDYLIKFILEDGKVWGQK